MDPWYTDPRNIAHLVRHLQTQDPPLVEPDTNALICRECGTG